MLRVHERLMVYHPKPQITWSKMRENVGEAKGIKNKFNAFNEWINSKRHKGEWTHCTKVGEARNDLCFFSCLALLICWHTVPFSGESDSILFYKYD
jgi:hypothetical protein